MRLRGRGERTASVERKISILRILPIKRFVNEGAHVFITGRRKNELDAAVKEIGRNVTGVQGDVSKLADIEKLYSAVKEEKAKLDIVFANAGIGEFAPLGQISEDHFDKQFNVNVKGLLFTVQKTLPLLQPGGSIVLNASIVSSKGSQAFSVYSATKVALFAENEPSRDQVKAHCSAVRLETRTYELVLLREGKVRSGEVRGCEPQEKQTPSG